MRRSRFTIRNLMLVTVLSALDARVGALIRKEAGDEPEIPTFFFALSLVVLNLSGFGLVWVVSRIPRTPEEHQSPLMMSMGCLLVLILISAAPVLMFLLYSWSVEG